MQAQPCALPAKSADEINFLVCKHCFRATHWPIWQRVTVRCLIPRRSCRTLMFQAELASACGRTRASSPQGSLSVTHGPPFCARLSGLHEVGIVVDFFVCVLASATLVVASRVLAPARAVLAPCRPASYKLPFRRVSGRICMLQAKLCRWTQKPHESTQFGHSSSLTCTCRVGLCLLAVLLLRGLRAPACRGLSSAT